MKKNTKISLLIIIYIILILIIWIYLNNSKKNVELNIQKQLSGFVNFTGNVFSGNYETTTGSNQINSGSELILSGENKSEFDKFNKILNINNFIRKFTLPRQPLITSSMSYDEKSVALNKYLKENNLYFKNSQKLGKGYLYIKLNKELINGDIFIYFHDTKLNGYTVSGKLDKQSNLGNNKEFLYKLNSVPINKYYDGKFLNYDWLGNEINNTSKLHYIGGYTTTTDGNYIEEIIIVGI